MIFALLLALVIIGLGAVFALQNTAPITVQFLFWETGEISLALVLLITFVAGVVVTILASLPGLIRRDQTIRGLEKDVAAQRRRLGDIEKVVVPPRPEVEKAPDDAPPPPAS